MLFEDTNPPRSTHTPSVEQSALLCSSAASSHRSPGRRGSAAVVVVQTFWLVIDRRSVGSLLDQSLRLNILFRNILTASLTPVLDPPRSPLAPVYPAVVLHCGISVGKTPGFILSNTCSLDSVAPGTAVVSCRRVRRVLLPES